MDGKLGSVVVTAGAGALATMVGLFVVRKMRKYFRKKTEMQMSNRHLRLSTRCTWLISGKLCTFHSFDENLVSVVKLFSAQWLTLGPIEVLPR